MRKTSVFIKCNSMVNFWNNIYKSKCDENAGLNVLAISQYYSVCLIHRMEAWFWLITREIGDETIHQTKLQFDTWHTNICITSGYNVTTYKLLYKYIPLTNITQLHTRYIILLLFQLCLIKFADRKFKLDLVAFRFNT